MDRALAGSGGRVMLDRALAGVVPLGTRQALGHPVTALVPHPAGAGRPLGLGARHGLRGRVEQTELVVLEQQGQHDLHFQIGEIDPRTAMDAAAETDQAVLIAGFVAFRRKALRRVAVGVGKHVRHAVRHRRRAANT